MQGGLLPPSTRWDPETRARGMATIRHMKGRLMALEAVVASDMSEATGRNGQDAVDATPSPVPPPAADEARQHGQREAAPVPSTEDRVGDAADADQFPSPSDVEGSPPREQGLPVPAEEPRGAEAPVVASSRRTRGGDREGSPARPRPRRSTAEGLAAEASGELTGAGPGAAVSHPMAMTGPATLTDPMGPCAPDVPPQQLTAPVTQQDRCGWCTSTNVWRPPNTSSGRIHCLHCQATYGPSTGLWTGGQQDKRHNPPSSVPEAAA